LPDVRHIGRGVARFVATAFLVLHVLLPPVSAVACVWLRGEAELVETVDVPRRASRSRDSVWTTRGRGQGVPQHTTALTRRVP